jgi:hypothetical protein
MDSDQILELARTYCLQLPEVLERLSHGEAAFFIQTKKCFVMFANNHHNLGWVALWVAATLDFQQAMLQQNPSAYFIPPYVGHRGWLGIRLDTDLTWEILENHLLEAYCCVAPKRLRIAFTA